MTLYDLGVLASPAPSPFACLYIVYSHQDTKVVNLLGQPAILTKG